MNEWDDEPDSLDFEHAGLRCYLRRGPMKALCGYVEVPKGHPLNGHGYSDPLPGFSIKDLEGEPMGQRGIIPVFCAKENEIGPDLFFNVHGSVTYSGQDIRSIDAEELKERGGWLFGFDCSHAGDLSPGMIKYGRDDGVYRTIAYVEAECRSLADQLSKFKLKEA